MDKILINYEIVPIIQDSGSKWVSIKRVTEALSVNYHAVFRNLQKDSFLYSCCKVIKINGSDGRRRDMICLPLEMLHGWIFSLKSNNSALARYKKLCYEVLYLEFVNKRLEVDAGKK